MRTFYFPMVDFSLHKAHPETCWYSPYFYTSEKGYKMCLGINANGSGVDENGQEVAGQWVSVYVHMMRGNHDEPLPWPFQGKVTVALRSKDDSINNFKKDILLSSQEDWVGTRVAGSERSKMGWGFPTFVLHDDLHHYLENDTLLLIVDIVHNIL